MPTKNITIITFITIFGVSLFLIFVNLLSQEIPKPVVASLNSESSSQISSISSSAGSISSSQSVATATAKSSISSTSLSKSSSSEAPAASNGYKDGSYSAQTSYTVPRNQESISLNLNIKNDVVTSLEDTNSSGDRESASYQRSFESQIQSKVVGKKISEISLSRVSGASLTTNAFMKAITQIKSQAKL